ncbi:MAG: TetR/AcrR family transcriptional regulator [Lachnospiraceae bacterium]|nr:TetR/AcrR family transcriptional regulator [Lachnospiraceae bacterium]
MIEKGIKKERRRVTDLKILEAASNEFAEKGFSAATMSGIATRAGVSQGLVSQNFKSKEKLFGLVVGFVDELLFPEELEEEKMPGALDLIIDKIKTMSVEEPTKYAFLLRLARDSEIPKSKQEETEVLFQKSAISRAIQEAQEMGELPQVDAHVLYRIIMRLVVNVISWYQLMGLELPDNSVILKVVHYTPSEAVADEEKGTNYPNCALTLNDDYKAVYDIDMNSGKYTIFAKDETFAEKFGGETAGEDFFKKNEKFLKENVFKDDLRYATTMLSKSNMKDMLSKNPSYSVDFRLLIGGKDFWFRIKVSRGKGWPQSGKVVMGIFDNDQSYRLEQLLRSGK